MEVNVHHAKTNLSKLISAAESGEEVIIARNGKPAVKLVVVTPPAKKSRKHLLSAWEGLVKAPTQEEWDKIHQQFLDDMSDFSNADGEAASRHAYPAVVTV